MSMAADVRDQPDLNHQKIIALNFIRNPGIYVFRRHYRFGLRSHIMEVLKPEDVDKERNGVDIDGVRWFPSAKPLKMLRIFRTRFSSFEDALAELKRVKLTVDLLTPNHVAVSDEFLVSYGDSEEYDIILCGLQEYVAGEILDPWAQLDVVQLNSMLYDMSMAGIAATDVDSNPWLLRIRRQTESFIKKIKQMILTVHHVPDLAGAGNLLLTPRGDIKLVDINNISKVHFDSTVRLDDREYPVCDKSIEALSLLEKKLTGPIDRNEPIYRTYLDPGRVEEVRRIEKDFHSATHNGSHA
jgi:hypothetical protein